MTNSQNTCHVLQDVSYDKILRSPFSCLKTLMILYTDKLKSIHLLFINKLQQEIRVLWRQQLSQRLSMQQS